MPLNLPVWSEYNLTQHSWACLHVLNETTQSSDVIEVVFCTLYLCAV